MLQGVYETRTGCPRDGAGRCAAAMIDFLGASSKGHFQASHFSETAGKTLLASTDSVAGRDAVDVEARELWRLGAQSPIDFSLALP